MGKNDDSGADFTPEKIRVYEEFLRTGKIDGKTVTNQYEVARLIGTSSNRINKWHQEQNQVARLEKESIEHELEILQKKTQNKLIETIVRVSLVIIIGVVLIITGLYVYAMSHGFDLKILESMLSNSFGILLTNCFTIISTIMGVKYANKED